MIARCETRRTEREGIRMRCVYAAGHQGDCRLEWRGADDDAFRWPGPYVPYSILTVDTADADALVAMATFAIEARAREEHAQRCEGESDELRRWRWIAKTIRVQALPLAAATV